MPQAQRENLERFRDPIAGKILNLGLDLRGGMQLILELEVEKLDKKVSIQDAMQQAIEIIRNRIDQFGVSEPLISRQGDRWINVQLPGVKDPDRAVELVGKTALLEFKLIDEEAKVSDYLNEQGEVDPTKVPENLEVLPSKEEGFFVLYKKADVTGAHLTNAKVEIGGDYGAPYVSLTFNREGGIRFADLTGTNINKRLAIVLDGIVQSAPVIRSRIPDGKAVIEGNFTPEDAKNLSIVLRAGALPAPVRIIENVTVGPTLGADSIKKGMNAGLIALALVFLFMIFYYKFSGFLADIGLLVNAFILFGVMACLHATLTMPGIAGIILTIGMAVDANVLICERIKEELRAGKTVRLAVDAGYDRAFTTIVDSNMTTLITAVLLFQFGSGPVKGFAVSLTIGLLASMFTAIVVTKFIYEWILQNSEIKRLSI